jgi:UPF0716 protein FxsA
LEATSPSHKDFPLLLRLFLLLTIVPLLELTLLLTLARYTSVWFTLGMVVGTAVVGSILQRWQGGQVLRNVQREVNAGRMPTDAVIDAAMIFLAALFLITPGVLTDLLGISLLIPWCRQVYRWLAVRWIQANFKLTVLTPQASGEFSRGEPDTGRSRVDGDVIDGQATPVRDER